MGDLTKHFSKSELACKCCGELVIDERFLDSLELLRFVYNKPIIVTSGYRCPKHNSEVSHTGETGPHTTGKAVDIRCNGQETYFLVKIAIMFGFTGIGISQKGKGDSRFIHLDTLPDHRPRIWSY